MTNRTVPQTSIAIALLLMLLPAHASALHCNGDILTINTGEETYYIEDRSDKPGDINYWIYRESNGVEGLQTGGAVTTFPEECYVLSPCIIERCRHSNPDDVIVGSDGHVPPLAWQ